MLVLLVGVHESWAQGCSDAGFCTFGNLKHQSTDSVRGGKVRVLLPFGLGDEDVRIFAPALQYEYQFSEKWGIQAKVTANSASGNLGTASGPGDIYLAGIYTAPISPSWRVTGMIASKLPLKKSSMEKNGMSLPMVYQSSLGTVDLITGVSFMNREWMFSLGWQQPLTGENNNHFLPAYWDSPEAEAYPPSNEFNRKGDVLVRMSYSLGISPVLLLQGGLLNIYHLGEDTFVDPASANQRMAIKGSKGLTMNVTGSAWLTVSSSVKVGVTAGIPFVVRDIRPDGLTRSFVISPELQWRL